MSLIAGNHVAKNRRYQTPLSPGLGGGDSAFAWDPNETSTQLCMCVCVCNLLHIFSWRHRPRRRFGSDWMVAQIERHARTHAYCVGRGRLFGEPLCCYIVVWLRRAVCLTCTRSRTPTTTKKTEKGGRQRREPQALSFVGFLVAESSRSQHVNTRGQLHAHALDKSLGAKPVLPGVRRPNWIRR